MSKQEIGSIAVRVLSLFIIVRVVGTLPETLYIYRFDRLSDVIPPLLTLATALILAGLIWISAPRIGARVAGEQLPSSKEIVLPGAIDLQAIVFSVVGLVLLLWYAIPGFLGGVGNLITEYLNSPSAGPFAAAEFRREMLLGFAVNVGVSFVQSVLGIWLLLGSRRFVGLIDRMRPSYSED